MTDDAWKAPARFAVERMARRILASPQLEADPVCVVATERERMIEEIEEAQAVTLDAPKPVVEPQAVKPRRRGRAVA